MNAKDEELVKQYTPLAKSMAAKFCNNIFTYSDALSEALFGLVVAVLHYDPDRGHFGQYAKIIIRNRLLKAVHDEQKRLNLTADIDEAFDFEMPGEPFSTVEILDIAKEFKVMLTDSERQLVAMRLKHKTQHQCAETLGISQATVSRMFVVIREKFVSAFGPSFVDHLGERFVVRRSHHVH